MPEQPPYLRLADSIRERIASGEWAVGDRLPTRFALAEEYGLGHNVVRRAYDVLISQGVLEGRTGSGTYVSQPRSRLRMVRSMTRERRDDSPFRADMADMGRDATWDSHTDVKASAPADIAGRLGIAEGDLCVRTKYEFLSEGRPVQLSTSWEPYDLTSGTLVLLPEAGPHAGLGVVKRMELIGVTISRAVEQPEPRQATAEEMALLGVPRGTYVTNIQRTYYSDEGRPVETADIVIPASLCEIVYEVPINP